MTPSSPDDFVAVSGLAVRIERLGPLPIVNHFIGRLGLETVLGQFLPSSDRSSGLALSKALGILLRSVIVERAPIYQQGETVREFAPSAFGLKPVELQLVRDDAIGRALDHLFDVDRSALMTEVVVAAGQRFELRFDELHNDSTSIRFSGQYRAAVGRRIRGKRAPWINYGYSKDHRPDLKQLLFILTTTKDGGVPVQFRCEAGSASDARTHIETWEALRRTTGKVDFLYVADSKLCTRDNMEYITRQHGRFVTVLPRSRSEDEEFRRWIQTHTPPWELVWDRRNPRRRRGPRDRWYVFRYQVPTTEGYPLFWVWSTLLALKQEQGRRERIMRAVQELEQLQARLSGPRPRLDAAEVNGLTRRILRSCDVERYLEVSVRSEEEFSFRQEHRGRPGPGTRFRRLTRRRLRLEWTILDAVVAYDAKSDGMYPLVTNDGSLSGARVLAAHKGQPSIEKRFSQTKSVHDIAPVFLKNEGRIEALFHLYFFGLLLQALIERELRRAMKRESIESLPLYPEERHTAHPTTEQIFRLFAHAERLVIVSGERDLRVSPFRLSDLQRQVLRLLGVPQEAYGAQTR
jgi:transposase